MKIAIVGGGTDSAALASLPIDAGIGDVDILRGPRRP
jgi:hypothetical protein